MTSSVTPIELSPATNVRTDDATLTVELADGRVIATPLDWYPRLAHGTPDERAKWELIGDGVGIHWPALDEDVSVEGLIAGRKSGESTSSLKRWRAIQDELRRTTGFSGLRREVLRTGPLPADALVRRVLSEVTAYDSRTDEWFVAVTGDPFAALASRGVKEDSACAVYQAQSVADAIAVKAECVRAGLKPADAAEPPSDQAAYVAVHSATVR